MKIVFIVLLVFVSSFSQAGSVPLATVNGKRVGKLLFVPVTIDGKGPYWFCVDSGASHSVIDPSLVKELALRITRSSTTTGTGQGNIGIQQTEPMELALGSLRIKIHEPWVIDLSGVPIPKWTRGLVGAEFFESYVVEIDPDAPSLRFYNPTSFQPDAEFKSIPLITQDHKMFVDATLIVSEKKRVTDRLRIDTGSEDSVADDVVKGGDKVRETTLGHGLGANYKGYSGVFKAVHLGPFRFENVWGPAAPKPTIGMEIFRRFTTIFDCQRHLLYLRPNSHLDEVVPTPE